MTMVFTHKDQKRGSVWSTPVKQKKTKTEKSLQPNFGGDNLFKSPKMDLKKSTSVPQKKEIDVWPSPDFFGFHDNFNSHTQSLDFTCNYQKMPLQQRLSLQNSNDIRLWQQLMRRSSSTDIRETIDTVLAEEIRTTGMDKWENILGSFAFNTKL